MTRIIIIAILTFLSLLLNTNCKIFTRDQPDNYDVIRPLLENWTKKSTRVKKLTVVLDDEENIHQLPSSIFKDFNSSGSLLTLRHLTSRFNDTLRYRSIETGTFVLLLSTNILHARRILQTPYLRSFWHPENFYLLRETSMEALDNGLNDARLRFLEWAFDRLWRIRRVHGVVVSLDDKFFRFEPFKYENHLGRYSFNYSCNWHCVKYGAKKYRMLSMSDYNETNFIEDYTHDRMKFDGYPMKVTMFGTTTMIWRKGKVRGVDYRYIEETSKAMNITPVLSESKGGFGWEDKGIFFGMLGDVVYREADASFNQFFVKYYLTDDVEFTVPITSDKLCVMVPKAPLIPEHLVLARVFTPTSWIFIIVGHFLILMVYKIVDQRELYRSRNERKLELLCEREKDEIALEKFPVTRCRFVDQSCEFGAICRRSEEDEQWTGMQSSRFSNYAGRIYLFELMQNIRQNERVSESSTSMQENCTHQILEYLSKVLLQLMQPFQSRRPWLPERLLIICSLFLSLTLNGIFTSQLASSFSKSSYYEDIHTLEELDKSGFTILTNSRDIMQDALTDADSPLMKRLQRKMLYANETEINRRLLKKKDAALLYRKGMLPLRFSRFQRSELHLVEECPKHYIIANLVTKGSPFLRRINSILTRLNNGGFYNKWFQGMSWSLKRPHRDSKSKRHRKLTMRHLLIPFAILSIGLLTSTIVFVWEHRQSNL